MAAFAMAIIIRTSALLVPSLEMVAPKRVTSASFAPFMVMSAQVLVVMFTIIFDFFVLTYISYTPAHSYSLLIRSLSSLLESPMRKMSSANLKLEMSLPPMEKEVWWSWSVLP
ncbi:hypothetical protein DPMN_110901 [Dreissena polymorpha]|uniref:Uncharacterized protein n=1 Tax=Dreissena polymorpha TaxID=45954 RepID=A0A9D4QPD3_DREPO|nr:hypothetical protein DPMN_110901 [Dreissena polymorpha]